jgi:hypothetical protein
MISTTSLDFVPQSEYSSFKEEKFRAATNSKIQYKIVLQKFPRLLSLRRGGLNHNILVYNISFFQAGVVIIKIFQS